MIELKKYNYFTGSITSVAFGVGDIVKYYDLDGGNYLLLSPLVVKLSTLSSILTNNIGFKDIDDLKSIITDKSNLFRVDLLVFDFWDLSLDEISNFLWDIRDLDIKIAIVAKLYSYKTTDDVTDYHLRSEYKELNKSEIFITDNINKWTSSLSSLKKSHRRDKKIDGLFGESDT